jgi:hypothetical protein
MVSCIFDREKLNDRQWNTVITCNSCLSSTGPGVCGRSRILKRGLYR